MKAVLCAEPGKLALAERPEPGPPPPGWALVGIDSVGICGTDFHIFEGKHPFLQYPRVMGHEVSGHVMAVGEGVDTPVGLAAVINPYISCGTCVACRKGKPNCCTAIRVLGVHTDGALCQRLLVPAANLYSAEGLSPQHAAMVEFLAIGAHAVRRSLAEPGARALVIGAGPIGLGTAIFARIAGLDVTLLDSDAERLAFARDALDFSSTLATGATLDEEIRALTGGDGFDVVFDATGNARSIEAAFAFVAHGGALVLVSVVRDDITFSDPEFHKREMMLIGSRNATRQDFEHVMRMIREGQVPLGSLATHDTTLQDVVADLPRWAHDKSGLIKAIVAVGGSA